MLLWLGLALVSLGRCLLSCRLKPRAQRPGRFGKGWAGMLLNLRVYKRSLALALSLWASAICLAPRLHAQGSTASILGTVSDTSGAPIAEAEVRVKNVGTGLTQTFRTDAQGRFNVPDLGVGSYEAQASEGGFHDRSSIRRDSDWSEAIKTSWTFRPASWDNNSRPSQ